MSEAVDNSEVMLYAVSEAYKESGNCRLEANYAHQQDVDMIPLMVQEGYKAKGWLGLFLGTRLWYPFVSQQLPFPKSSPESPKNLLRHSSAARMRTMRHSKSAWIQWHERSVAAARHALRRACHRRHRLLVLRFGSLDHLHLLPRSRRALQHPPRRRRGLLQRLLWPRRRLRIAASRRACSSHRSPWRFNNSRRRLAGAWQT